jgi:hypothetical protein
MKQLLCIFILTSLTLNLSYAQINSKKKKTDVGGAETTDKNTSVNQPISRNTVYARVINGDTIPMITLREFSVYAPRTFSSPKEAKKYDRFVRDVKRAYPYARVAGEKLREYNAQLATFKTDKERKKFLNEKEKEIKTEFEKDIRNLTLKQGIILIKLIDRETGNTSYDLLKDMRGTLSAFMWQSLARIFSANLKLEYDAKGEDKAIEEVVLMIERGEI